MLRSLKEFLDCVVSPQRDHDTVDETHRLQLATAVLLVEVMRADAAVGAAERSAVVAALRRKFGLDGDEIARLLELAERSQREATDFHAFTSALNDHFDHAQKVRMIEAMWSVAYADGQLAAHENHVLWRISDLLHVPHAAYIGAKLRAKAEAGID